MDLTKLEAFPIRRIKAEDGMAVTADVWDEAHDYHRQRQRYHDLLHHGSGIVAGLEVIASDPPDSSVYILPGVAIDPQGQVILLTEPVAYDVGAAHELLHLLLTYEESRPARDQEDGPLYVHAQFGIEAMRDLPDTPHLELARIRRRDRDATIADARNPEFPGMNEIDLRHRREMSPSTGESISLAVCYTGGAPNGKQGHGLANLARSLRSSGRQVWVDDHVPLTSDLDQYALVYLVGHDAFQLSRDEMNALYAYLQAGGTVFIESCRKGTDESEPAADASFADVLASMGIELQPVERGHRLLAEPNLFAAVPAGFETGGTPSLQIGGGVILSTYDYGCLWQGDRRDGPAAREEIRAAMEWGDNLLTYAVASRKKQ
jgi:hypothetical protein